MIPRCYSRTEWGTCIALNHVPRCGFWRQFVCPEGWLVPFVILISIAIGAVAWRFILPL